MQTDKGAIEIRNDPREIESAQERLIALIERHGYARASLFALRLAVHEALVNAFRHGHKTLAAPAPVKVAYTVGDRSVRIAVQDKGPGFRPQDVPDPTDEANLERGSGRGLLLIRSYMSKVEHNTKGNRLVMVYKKPKAAQ